MGVKEIYLDDRSLPDGKVPLRDDGQPHRVEVKLQLRVNDWLHSPLPELDPKQEQTVVHNSNPNRPGYR